MRAQNRLKGAWMWRHCNELVAKKPVVALRVVAGVTDSSHRVT